MVVVAPPADSAQLSRTSNSLVESRIARAPSETTLFSSREVTKLILGGRDCVDFWGFDLTQFQVAVESRAREHIVDPASAPWLGLIDYTAEDRQQLRTAIATLDPAAHPAEQLSSSQVESILSRSRVLGLSGPIGSGKDTLADAFEARGAQRMSFADPLRVSAAMMFGIPLRYFLARDLKEKALPGVTDPRLSPRRVIQLFGTEVVRAIHEPVWVQRAALRIASSMLLSPRQRLAAPAGRYTETGGVNAVIADVRFENEAAFVRGAGGRLVRVSRPSLDAAKTATFAAGHISESGISAAPTDVAVVNAGTLEQFRDAGMRAINAAYDAANLTPSSRPGSVNEAARKPRSPRP